GAVRAACLPLVPDRGARRAEVPRDRQADSRALARRPARGGAAAVRAPAQRAGAPGLRRLARRGTAERPRARRVRPKGAARRPAPQRYARLRPALAAPRATRL